MCPDLVRDTVPDNAAVFGEKFQGECAYSVECGGAILYLYVQNDSVPGFDAECLEERNIPTPHLPDDVDCKVVDIIIKTKVKEWFSARTAEPTWFAPYLRRRP